MNIRSLLFFIVLLTICQLIEAKNLNFIPVKLEEKTDSILIQEKKQDFKPEVAKVENELTEEFRNLIATMQEQKFISDNVECKIKVEVLEEASGQGMKINYSYSLLADTLKYQSDDFALGNYLVKTSNATLVTLFVMKKSIEGKLAPYFKQGREISIAITGSADVTPIKKAIPYTEEFGKRLESKCEVDGKERLFVVTKATGIMTNNSLAFVRSYAVRNYIENNIEALKQAKVKYSHKVEVISPGAGQYNRLTIELIIPNAF